MVDRPKQSLGMIKAKADPYDYSDQFNTSLTPEETKLYNTWAAANPRLSSKYDYDAQGFFKSGQATSNNGHATDIYIRSQTTLHFLIKVNTMGIKDNILEVRGCQERIIPTVL